MNVTKLGGSIAEATDVPLDELAGRSDTALVHGFGPQTTRRARQLERETRWITSPDGVRSRFTDEATLEIMQAVAREVGESIVERLEARSREAVRLHGPALLTAEAKTALRHQREDGRTVLVRGNRSGRVTGVDPSPVERVLETDRVPVVTPLAADDHGLVSVDADRAAARIGAELDAEALVLLTDVDRVLDATGDPVESLTPSQAEQLVDEGVADGGMLRKLVAAIEAIQAGVPRVLIADGRRQDPIQRALEGDATEVVP